MSIENIKYIYKDIENKNFKYIYFLKGEDFIIETIFFLLKQKILYTYEEIDIITLYGNETNIEYILNIINQKSIYNQRKLIIIKNFNKIKNSDKICSINTLFLEKNKINLLILYSEEYIKNKKINNFLISNKFIYEFQLPNKKNIYIYIKVKLDSLNIQITNEAIKYIVYNLEYDLINIYNEIDKLSKINNNTKIDLKTISLYINSKIEKYNIFDLCYNLESKNLDKCLIILEYLDNFEKNSYYNKYIIILYNFFLDSINVKLYLNNNLKIFLNKYILQKKINIVNKYSLDQYIQILSIIKDYELIGKGIRKSNLTEKENLLNLIFKINKI